MKKSRGQNHLGGEEDVMPEAEVLCPNKQEMWSVTDGMLCIVLRDMYLINGVVI